MKALLKSVLKLKNISKDNRNFILIEYTCCCVLLCFADYKEKTCCRPLVFIKTENKNKKEILNYLQIRETPFSSIFCYATVIPPLFNENDHTPPTIDALASVHAAVNSYIEVGVEGTNQSFVEQSRIGPFLRTVTELDQPRDLNYRISTFQYVVTDISALRLARNGWYYCVLRKGTKCYICDKRRDKWKCNDVPSEFHWNRCR